MSIPNWGKKSVGPIQIKNTTMARYGAESATFWGVVFKRAKIGGGCFGYWKIQNGPSVFHIDPLHGLIWPRCKGQFSPKFWYQNSPISVGLNWPPKQYHSGLTRFGPIFGAKLALFILQCATEMLTSLTPDWAVGKSLIQCWLLKALLSEVPILQWKLFFMIYMKTWLQCMQACILLHLVRACILLLIFRLLVISFDHPFN